MFKRVTELEWYLSLKAFSEKLLSFGTENTKEMTITDFHKFWTNLTSPKQLTQTAIIVFTPFNCRVLLGPGEDINIPLGFIIPENVEWAQSLYEKGLIFSTGKSYGNAEAKGALLRITNTNKEPYPLNLAKDTPLASGVINNEGEAFYTKVELMHKSGDTSDFSLLAPGVYDCKDEVKFANIITDMRKNWYVSIADVNQEYIAFYIQKKLGNTYRPLTDPVLDVISSKDTKKYNAIFLHEEQNKPLDEIFENAFREMYCQTVLKEDRIPNKRYVFCKKVA